jgi:aquaporin Z
MLSRLKWPEYLMEAAGLGVFMLSACVSAALLEDPASALRRTWQDALSDPFVRRCWMGAAMGATAIGIFYSPLAKRSGAHINPAVTLAFWRLGRIGARDALAYAFFQTLGGTLGVLLAAALARESVSSPLVNFAVTVPGGGGPLAALLGETTICFVMMSSVLACSRDARWQPFGGLASAVLLALFIVFEAPLSGTSLNPARTLASAFAAGTWTHVWIYFAGPVAGMLAAAEIHLRLSDSSRLAWNRRLEGRPRPFAQTTSLKELR